MKYRTSSGHFSRQQTGALSIKLPAGSRNELTEHNMDLLQLETYWGFFSDEGDIKS